MKFGRKKDTTTGPTYGSNRDASAPPLAVTLSATALSVGPNGRIVLRETSAELRRSDARSLEALREVGDLSVIVQPEEGRTLRFVGTVEWVGADGHLVLREVEGGSRRVTAIGVIRRLAEAREELLVTLRRQAQE